MFPDSRSSKHARGSDARTHGHCRRPAPHGVALEGTTEAPHFDRAAFRVARIYVTLAADGKSANFKLAPDEQELKCTLYPEAFVPVSGGWGRQGWTTATLAALSKAELKDALETAWRHAVVKKKSRR